MGTIVVLDRASDLIASVAGKDEAVIQIGAAYLAHEAALPLESQNPMPPLADVQAAYMAAAAALDSAIAGEHKRATAAESFGQTLAIIEDQLQWALAGRIRQFPQTPAAIEAWGVDTVLGPTSRRMVFPERQAGWIRLLNDYITKEESLLPEEQWADPPLADFETWREQLQTSDTARTEGLNQRRQGVKNRKLLTAVLKRQLNLALHVLIERQFDGMLNLALADWGFKVQYRQSSSTGAGDETPVAEPITEPAAETAVAATATTMSAPDTALDTAPLTPTANGAAH